MVMSRGTANRGIHVANHDLLSKRHFMIMDSHNFPNLPTGTAPPCRCQQQFAGELEDRLVSICLDLVCVAEEQHALVWHEESPALERHAFIHSGWIP